VFDSIRSFLSDRHQQVRLGNQLCKLAIVTNGVPQRSVLGLLLFQIFIDELFGVLSPLTPVKGFADDLKMYLSIHSTTDHAVLQCSLDNLSDWSISWQMKIATQKCFLSQCSFLSQIGGLQSSNQLTYFS